MIAEFNLDVAAPVILISVPLVFLGALVLAVALCRTAAQVSLSEREVAQSQRPRGGVSSVEPVDGADFPGLMAWGDELRERTEARR